MNRRRRTALAAVLIAIAACSESGTEHDRARAHAEYPAEQKPLRESPEFQAALAQMESEMQETQRAEQELVEAAEWFGTTGLPDQVERGISKYLRLEFGESVLDPDSLKASDLEYFGAFHEGSARVHYWRVPSSLPGPLYAYVQVSAIGEMSTGMGGRAPPAHPNE